MTKFTVQDYPEVKDESKPVLYKVWFGNNYYIHKGKKLKESVDRFLEDVFRGMRNKSCPPQYSEVVKHCLKYPAIHKVMVELISNAEPDTIFKKESALYKAAKNDEFSLINSEIEPYKPEWMIKQALQKRCDNDACITSGVVNKKKLQFKFCPNCGRLNKVKATA